MQAETSLLNFASDLRAGVFQHHAMPESAFARARQISRKTTAHIGTRTADLLHVAAAVELSCERLYSFDDRQRKLAHAVKLKLNPLS